MLQLLMLTRLLGIALRTAELSIFGLSPFGAVAWRLRACYNAFRTGTYSTRLISWSDLALIRNLVVFEHATQLTLAFRIVSGLQCVQGRRQRVNVAAFTLEVTVRVHASRRGMAAVSSLLALIDVDASVVSHLVARLAFAVIPKTIVNVIDWSVRGDRTSYQPGMLMQIELSVHP